MADATPRNPRFRGDPDRVVEEYSRVNLSSDPVYRYLRVTKPGGVPGVSGVPGGTHGCWSDGVHSGGVHGLSSVGVHSGGGFSHPVCAGLVWAMP